MKSPTVPTPGQYRATEDVPKRLCEPGTRVRLVKWDEGTDTGVVVRGTSSYTVPAHEFRAGFLPDPSGEAAYFQEIMDISGQLGSLTTHLSDLETQLAHQSFALNRQNGDVVGVQALMDSVHSEAEPEPDAPLQGTEQRYELIKRTSTTRLQQARSTVLGIQTTLTKTREQIDQRQSLLKELTSEAMTTANALMKPLRVFIEKLSETITTLDLYAGSNEVLHTITSGSPAPESVPLTIVQGVLSMAEEAAMRIESGGLDAQNVDEFVAWLSEDPSRADAFLPEQKGVVALVPTWQERDYGDRERNRQMAEANTETYLLIRNGENLYLVTTNFHAGRTLTPTQSELHRLFTTEHGPFEPGSHEYLKAEARASALERHYYRIALLLQGLIDRTALFQPLPQDAGGVRRVLLTQPEDYLLGRVRLIEDVSMALDDPREPFSAWQARINAEMEVGRRIVGHWSHPCFQNKRDGDEQRFFPKGAYSPRTYNPLTLEARKGSYFVARYERPEVWLDSDSPRASVRVLPEDAGVILFDHPEVTPDLIRDLLSRRQQRAAYLDFVPLLKKVLIAKEAEAQAERPFLTLLTELGMRLHGMEEAESARGAAEAILSYKQARKLHTPLPVDDTAAFAACADLMLKQAGLKTERAVRRERGEFEAVTRDLLTAHPEAMLICHLSGNDYAALVPHREDESVYARILLYARSRSGDLKLKEDRPWRTVPGTWRRHEALHTSARWATWQMYAPTTHAFTDDETAELRTCILHMQPDNEQSHDRDSRNGLLLMISEAKHPLRFEVYRDSPAIRDRRNVTEPMIRAVVYQPRRTRDGIVLEEVSVTIVNLQGYNSNFPGALAWEVGGRDPMKTQTRRQPTTPLRSCPERLAALLSGLEEAKAAAKQERARNERVWKAIQSLHAPHEAAWWVEQHERFLRDYGHESAELWADHQKAVKSTYKTPMALRGLHAEAEPIMQAIRAAHAQGLDLEGRSVEDVLKLLEGSAPALSADLLTLTFGKVAD